MTRMRRLLRKWPVILGILLLGISLGGPLGGLLADRSLGELQVIDDNDQGSGGDTLPPRPVEPLPEDDEKGVVEAEKLPPSSPWDFLPQTGDVRSWLWIIGVEVCLVIGLLYQLFRKERSADH